jgi:hypothetical protein
MGGAAASSAREQELDSNDITLRAADRLEAALERLAMALETRLAAPAAPQDLPRGDMVSRDEVVQLSARLDAALERLRGVLGEDGGAGI